MIYQGELLRSNQDAGTMTLFENQVIFACTELNILHLQLVFKENLYLQNASRIFCFVILTRVQFSIDYHQVQGEYP